jgi:hypothetical protein
MHAVNREEIMMIHRWYIPVFFTLLLASSLEAQPTWGLDRGSVLVGGNASYYEAGGEVQSFSTAKSWDLYPYAYYCVAPNVAVGGALLLSSETRSGFESSTLAGRWTGNHGVHR